MTQLSSLHLDLQCTGVTPAPLVASPRLPKTSFTQDAVRDPQDGCQSREPLHDSNTQSALGGSSQKRSHTTTESFAVTPSEKRQTVLALSPQRPLGQQFDTLEVQRMLSLTPGKKPDFGHSPTQQSIQGGHPACDHSSPGSSAPASTNPASHKTSDSTRQQTASPQSRPSEEPADAPHLLHDTCPATEPQLADFPATQPVYAASALDLIALQTTQLVTTDAGAADTCQPNLAVHCNESSAQHALRYPSGPVLGFKHASGCEPTPMLHLLAADQDTEAVPHGRAPAGPFSSSSPLRHGSTNGREAAQAATGPVTISKQPAGQAHEESRVVNPAAAADQMLPGSSTELLLDSAQPVTCKEPGGQQSQLQSRCHPEPAVAMPPGTAPSLDPSSLATGMETEDASLSQESLDGTQAEADALMEKAANAFMHGASDEAEGCLLLNVSTTTLHQIVAALGRPCHTWRSQDLVKMERAVWTARLHEKLCEELAYFSFEGTRVEISHSDLSSWVQGELCDASEEAQRLAEWQATGRISSLSDQVPFSCSAAGSSADPLEPPAGTQVGNIMEQAAAIISYSQVAHDHTSTAEPLQPASAWLPQAGFHAAQTQKEDTPKAPPYASQNSCAAAAPGMVQCSPGQADAAAGGVLQCPSNQADAAADTAAEAVCLPAPGGQEKDQSNPANASPAAALPLGHAASQSGAVQGHTQLHSAAVLVSLSDADAKASARPAEESQAQAGAVASGAVLQNGCALLLVAEQRSAAAAGSKHSPAVMPAVAPAAEAGEAADDAMSQEVEEDLGDLAPTEVQVPDQASLPRAAGSQGQRSPPPLVAPAGGSICLTDAAQSDVHQADAEASPQVIVGAEAGSPPAVSAYEAPSASQQMLPGSPTPDLQLRLTYLEPEQAAHHDRPAGEAAVQQLHLHLATEPSMPEPHAGNVMQDESCQDGVQSPAELDLNLDNQLPDPSADRAPSVCAPVGGQKSPALKRGWWNQPWSVAQHVQPAEDADSLPAVGFWGASNCDAVAAEGTEVTPSGLRPSRGHSLTPVPHLPSTGAKQSTSSLSAKSHSTVPQGRSPLKSLLIADSEEPLVLPRSNGPARKAFQDAHTVPCSSPNSPANSPTKSPTDPLCSYVPATADGTSPHRNAQKPSSPSKAHTKLAARTGRHNCSPAERHLPTLAQAQAGLARQDKQHKSGQPKSRHGKKKSKGKTKAAAPQMGPPGRRYRAGLPVPRYHSHPLAPSVTPPSRQLLQKPAAGGQAQPGSVLQPSPPQAAAAVRTWQQQPAALQICTMEQLPVGGTAFSSAFNGCTMEQLPTGSHTASPAQVASTAQARGFTSPAAMMRQGQGRLSSPGQQQGQEQEQSRGQGVAQGLGQGMHGIGLSARNAAAAFCSARWQTAEPRNPYSLEDSLSEPADLDTARSPAAAQRPSAALGASGAEKAETEAQQAEHAGMGGGRVPRGPPQQSRCKWQLKGSAQAAVVEVPQKRKQSAGGAVPCQPCRAPTAAAAAAAAARPESAKHAAGKAGKKKKRGSGSIALDKPVRKRQPPPRWNDMVGHSQLQSDMLEASPPQLAAADGKDDDTVAEPAHAAAAGEAPMGEHKTDDKREAGNSVADEALQDAQDSPDCFATAQGSHAPVPEPGRKRKRSRLCCGGHQDAAPAGSSDTAEPDEQDAAHPEAAAKRKRSALLIRQAQEPRIKIPALGCSKCRHSTKGCKKCRSDQAKALQAAAAAQPGDTASAAADTHAQDKQPASATAVRPLRASCPAGRAPPQEPSTHRRQSRRHSTGPGQGHSAAAPANFAAPSDAAEEEEDLAAVQEMASGQLTDRRESLATSDQGAAGLHAGKQEKADPHSPAVTAQRHQHRSKGSLKADWRQGRASLSSPVAGTGGPRQHRRASLGGGGVLPLAGHSFLLTAYDDDKQKKVVTQRITHLGGCVLEDIPKPPGPHRSSLGVHASHPVLAVIASIPKRTHKVMYACIKGVPTLKESWLTACVAAHKLQPFDAFQQDVTQRKEGHRAFQGLAIHLAGAPPFQHTWGRLLRHAGGEVVGGVGDVTSPSKGWHHALQGPCHCILSEFKQGTDEDQQVQRLARRLRLPVMDQAWAVIGFEEGALPALPLLSPAKSSPTKPCKPPASPSIALPSPALEMPSAPRANQSGDAAGGSHTAGAAAACRQAKVKRGRTSGNAPASAGAKPGPHSRTNKRRRRLLVLPDSQPHEEQEQAHKHFSLRTGKGSRAPTAGPMDSSRVGHGDRGSAEEELTAADTSEVVADSMDISNCAAGAAGDMMDDVSSADTGHHEHPYAQQAQHDALQGQHQAQQQPGVLTTGEQGRAGGAAGQLAGLGQHLNGDIQWVGTSIDPPRQMGLAPSQHQIYYKAFSRGGMKVKVGDCVEVSHLGDDSTHLLQLKALWSEPTQTRPRMQALGQYFYRAEDTRLQTKFPEHEVFSSDKEETVALAAIMCMCSITYNASPAGSHIYHCHFAYDYETNSLSPSKFSFS